MSRLEEIVELIEELSPQELSLLRTWLLDWDWEHWDRQIERGAAGGRLNSLFAQALQGQRQGKSRPF